MGWEILKLLLLDAVFLAICVAVLVPLGLWRKAAWAVMKRNFTGYFSNPTGYAFLCLFVWLTSIIAFWPHEFFTTNLATLDQLNQWLPFIMLIYIPAITMSIWAEERQQGTDELLLTLPADDYDIVIGKFFAAGAVFTASLLFAQLSNFAVLLTLSLGNIDTGLLFTTYIGYWLVGLAMISLGMVASFLTNNLTISFVLGLLFNFPLALASRADVLINIPGVARAVAHAGFGKHLDDLGRGVLSSSSIIYFVMVIVIGVYLSMVLIGRRHWMGGKDGESMFLHYLIRAVALVMFALGVSYFFTNHDLFRIDTTEGRVSSMSSDTRELLSNLDPERPIKIEAFISEHVPELYVQTKYNLISLLKEFGAASDKVQVVIHNNLETFGEEATRAEQLYGIRPQMVTTRTRGAIKEEEIMLAAAFTSGVDKVVIPFFDYGIPVEYELVRSIDTVRQKSRKRLGIVRTEAQLNGGFSMAGGMPREIPKQELVSELEKQYDVEEVDASSPIELGKYEVLLVVQPSSLTPPQFNNLVEAVKSGQPTAIFEDPQPQFLPVTPTGQEKQAPGGGMFGGGGGPQPKGNIQELWNVLGIKSDGKSSFMGNFEPQLVWQKYSPYPKLEVEGLPDEWIFATNTQPGVEQETGKEMALNGEDPITSGLAEILFPVPGFIEPEKSSDLEFYPLVTTGTTMSGTVEWSDFRGIRDPGELELAQGAPTARRYTLAARIQSVVDDPAGSDNQDAKKSNDSENADKSDGGDTGNSQSQRPINVVYVADIDLLSTVFFSVRARPDDFEQVPWRFENVTFVLNIIDALAGEDRYIKIRKRKPRHSTLVLIEKAAEDAQVEVLKQRAEFKRAYDQGIEEAKAEEEETVRKVDEIAKKLQEDQAAGKEIDQAKLQAQLQQVAIKRSIAERQRVVKEQRLKSTLDSNVEKIQRQADRTIRNIQTRCKLWAVFLPPIPPALIGLVVWINRRMREREGIARSRLR
jgi:ABC-2 type transport system permease protein